MFNYLNMCFKESNFKRLGTKILMSRLKQDLIKSQLKNNEDVKEENDCRTNQNYASSFIPPLQNTEMEREGKDQVSLANPEEMKKDVSSNSDIEWEDGYTDLGRGKRLEGIAGSNEIDSPVDSEEDMEWVRMLLRIQMSLMIGCCRQGSSW